MVFITKFLIFSSKNLELFNRKIASSILKHDSLIKSILILLLFCIFNFSIQLITNFLLRISLKNFILISSVSILTLFASKKLFNIGNAK